MKRLLFIGFFSLFLGACANQVNSPSSIVAEKEQVVNTSDSSAVAKNDVDSGMLSETGFEDLLEAPLVKIDASQSVSSQLASATNGVMKTSIDGKEQVSYRSYQVPKHWELFPGVLEDDRHITYLLTLEQGQVIVPFSIENAYTSSPLQGGQVATAEELEETMAYIMPAVYRSSLEIEGKEWQVAYGYDEADKKSGLLFYHLENTGNFDDSLLMTSMIFPKNILEQGDLEQLKTSIGELKAILAQLVKD